MWHSISQAIFSSVTYSQQSILLLGFLALYLNSAPIASILYTQLLCGTLSLRQHSYLLLTINHHFFRSYLSIVFTAFCFFISLRPIHLLCYSSWNQHLTLPTICSIGPYLLNLKAYTLKKRAPHDHIVFGLMEGIWAWAWSTQYKRPPPLPLISEAMDQQGC